MPRGYQHEVEGWTMAGKRGHHRVQGMEEGSNISSAWLQ